jgi:anti-sigma-K factor RskA
MSEQDDLRDLYELYALGVLEEPERSQIEAALRAGDLQAKERLRKAMESNAMLLAATPLVDPPKRLRGRVMATVGVSDRNWGWLGILATAAAGLLIATFYLGSQSRHQEQELATLRSEMQMVLQQSAKTNTELARTRHVLDFLNAAETRLVTFGPKDPTPPRGKVLLHPGRGVLLIAANLPPAPAGKLYEMWIIPKGGQPVPAGLFQSDDTGNSLHLKEGAVAIDSAIAVTLEPEAGSAQPTSTPLFVATL